MGTGTLNHGTRERKDGGPVWVVCLSTGMEVGGDMEIGTLEHDHALLGCMNLTSHC